MRGLAKALVKVMLWLVWLYFIPFCLTELMYRYPRYVPFPESVGRWLFDQYRRFDPAEDGHDFEFALCWLLAFVTTVVGTVVVLRLFRRHHNRKEALHKS